MRDWRWSGAVAFCAIAAWAASESASRPLPIVAGTNLGPELTPLEATVSRHPDDPEALAALVDTYLEHDAPGLAEAALSRAPAELLERPELADRHARTLTRLGNAPAALGIERRVLDACRREGCRPGLVARATRRAAWLEAMHGLGVDDANADPDRALLAYRLVSRDAQLAVD